MEQLTDAFEQLSDKQQKAVIELLQQPSIAKAADAAGVGRSTLYLWLKQPDFAEAYRAARSEALSHATARLQQAASGAVDTLDRLASNQNAPASAQVAAASKILEFAYRADRLAEIEALLEELKADNDE